MGCGLVDACFIAPIRTILDRHSRAIRSSLLSCARMSVSRTGVPPSGFGEAGMPYLAEIPAFGKVLAISRNSHAVLGTICEYPEVDSVPCGHCGSAVDGSLEFDFTSWQRAVAVVEARGSGWLYAVEFFDGNGEVIHKICLTEQSDFETFRCWVELNQTIADIQPGAAGTRAAVPGWKIVLCWVRPAQSRSESRRCASSFRWRLQGGRLFGPSWETTARSRPFK